MGGDRVQQYQCRIDMGIDASDAILSGQLVSSDGWSIGTLVGSVWCWCCVVVFFVFMCVLRVSANSNSNTSINICTFSDPGP